MRQVISNYKTKKMFTKIISYSGNHEIEKVLGIRLTNHKNSVLIGIVLLIPASFMLGALTIQTITHRNFDWLQVMANWPLWFRLVFFYCVIIIFPVSAFLINLRFFFSIWFDKDSQELKLSFKQNWSSLILSVIGLGIAALFVGHLIADSLAGQN